MAEYGAITNNGGQAHMRRHRSTNSALESVTAAPQFEYRYTRSSTAGKGISKTGDPRQKRTLTA